jgi:cell division protein FtsW (lipid II flippase)
MTVRTHPTTSPTTTGRRTTYARQVPLVLAAAFTLSVVHTVHSSIVGIADPGWEVTDPGVWAFYAVAFGMTAMSRRDDRRIQAGVLAFLVALLGIAMLVYPSMFGPEQQTTFGWIENDLYVGGLATAAYLTVLRLRRVTIAPTNG